MPTYDYECQACGHTFEKFQTMTARVLRKCPECSESKLQRLIGPGAGFLFKGDGFYQTDYRSKSYKDGEKSNSDASSSDSTKKSADSKTSTDSNTGAERPAKSDGASTSTDNKPSSPKKKPDKN